MHTLLHVIGIMHCIKAVSDGMDELREGGKSERGRVRSLGSVQCSSDACLVVVHLKRRLTMSCNDLPSGVKAGSPILQEHFLWHTMMEVRSWSGAIGCWLLS